LNPLEFSLVSKIFFLVLDFVTVRKPQQSLAAAPLRITKIDDWGKCLKQEIVLTVFRREVAPL
jgi:hypothetical protein